MGPNVRRGRARPRTAIIAGFTGAALVAGAVLAGTPAVAADGEIDLAFDFGGPSTPVADGWSGVNPGTAYTAERGYGFTTAPASNGFRDRGGDDLMARDFTIGNTQAFAVDVPNGTYEVTTWAGDLIAGNTTNWDVEGTTFSGPRTSSGAIHEQFFEAVQVADGQLNIRVPGGDGRINGIRVQTPLAAPAGLTASEIDADGDLSVTLEWQSVPDATGYAIFRATPGGVLAELSRVTDGATTTFTDDTVALGETYEYAVATVKGERVSRASEPIEASVVDPDVAAPATPTGIETSAIGRDELTLEWTDPGDAVLWKVYRSTREDIPFDLVATVEEPTFTDTDVLTTRPYLYRLVALNAGGTSETSETYATEVATTLVRQAEYLDRAPVAVELGDGEGVYLGWRLLGLDARDLGFTVHRDGERITDEPVTGATNLVDPDGTAESTYLVTVDVDGREVSVTDDFGVWSDQFLDVPLDRPAGGTTPTGQEYTYSPGDASVGDLDGDGEYELVFQWYPSNAKDNSQSGYTGNVYLDAIELDGTKLWRMDLGVNIRAGAHYTQFQVYDLDGDGRAEVSFKTADGTTDGVGTVIGDPSADHRNSSGYILSGPEYLTVFDGATGAALDTVDYLPGRGNVSSWGDGYGNRVDRFLAGVGTFDGERPSLLFTRGYYTRSVLVAWDFREGELVERWTFDSNDAGSQYEGQGNHQLVTADVDRDGLDEVVFGAMTIDDDGTPLYNTRLFHGDALHVGDLDPARPGQEVFGVHESPSGNGGVIASFRDAETGEIVWKTDGSRDTGRGAAADIDPTSPGAEAWSIGGDAAWNSPVGSLKSATGEELSTDIPAANFVTWWDGDLTREITDHDYDATTSTGVPTVSKWNPETSSAGRLLTAEGMSTNNTTKGTPMLQADLFGDWREELVVRHASNDALRIYTTTDATEHRIPTLMHDPQYRQAVAWQNTSYNQPPHPSYFIGEGMAEPPMPSIAYAGEPAADVTAPEITGLPEGTVVDSEPLQLAIGATDAESGIRSVSVTIGGEEVAPDATVDLAELGLAGEVTVVATATNHAGLTAEASSTLLVVPDTGATSAPGRANLSNTSGWEYGLHDGNYDVVMNLWSGTPGSIFRLYENDELVLTRVLDATGALPQTAGLTIEGKPNGTYVYTGELINSVGATATTSTTVKVTDAAPGTPVVSHDNANGKASSFTATANLWWGTNATSYRFELDGVVVGSGSLVASTPNAQSASVQLTDVAPGTHTLVAVFANANGETASKPVKVTVK
ncbi:rhamnogalacturonan lyase family protein [Agromyces sp. ZXT2-3]|uniref:rhamnogalacturonan lyase family protein n=1 Tax=Agromyces sp. ZXT2-3 TaxID=3461152 RepID=UPI004054ACEA